MTFNFLFRSYLPPYFVAACKAVVIIALSDVLVNVAPVVESTLLSSVTSLVLF